MLFFLQRNQVLIGSLLCLLFSLYLLAAAADGRLRGDPVGPLLLEVLRPLQLGAEQLVARVEWMEEGLAGLVGTARENRRLHQRIVALEIERQRLLEIEAANKRLVTLLSLKEALQAPSIAARVIANSGSTWFRSLTLDMGSRDGVQRGMAVVSPLGVVGQVVGVTGRSSKVLLATDPHSGIDVVVQHSRARGIVSGSLDNGPVMKYVGRTEEVQVGDRLITSGLDGVFPKGLLVATVTEVRKKHYGLFQTVQVALAVDPSRIEEVLVVSWPSEGRE